MKVFRSVNPSLAFNTSRIVQWKKKMVSGMDPFYFLL